MLIESENCKNVDFYDNKNMIVRNEINRALVHIDIIWYMRILSERNGLRHRPDFIICVFFITACVLLYTATFRMIRHMLACFLKAFLLLWPFPYYTCIYIYLPILPSTCTDNTYINANHKLVYHYLTYFAILQSATWTVYGLQYVSF